MIILVSECPDGQEYSEEGGCIPCPEGTYWNAFETSRFEPCLFGLTNGVTRAVDDSGCTSM